MNQIDGKQHIGRLLALKTKRKLVRIRTLEPVGVHNTEVIAKLLVPAGLQHLRSRAVQKSHGCRRTGVEVAGKCHAVNVG